MKKLKPVLIGVGIVLILISVGMFIIGYFRPKGAGLLIESSPASTVYLDGEQVGRTLYETTRKPGEVTVKLIPEAQGKIIAPFETRVILNSKIQTVIKRDFGETDETSQGEIISFEKVGGKEAGLAIVSIPDSAQISVDGAVRGFAPYKTTSLLAGEHQLAIVAPGYLERTVSVRTLPGYKLTVVVKLASGGATATPTPTPTMEAVKVTLVEILSTPTGYLRVRKTSTTSGEILIEVKPGEKYRYLETDEATGWYKIEYAPGKEGWVSNQYSKKVDDFLTTPTPTTL
jgi:hypothetical protein